MSTPDLDLSFCPMVQPPSKKTLLAFQKDAGWSFSQKQIDNILKADGKLQWVSVERDNVKIGLARLELAAPEFCHVSDLVIKSRYRGRGVGRWLLRNIETYCARLGIRRILLHPEVGSKSFYESLSFAPDPLVPGVLKKDISLFQPKMFSAR